jgi:hypothetical protein
MSSIKCTTSVSVVTVCEVHHSGVLLYSHLLFMAIKNMYYTYRHVWMLGVYDQDIFFCLFVKPTFNICIIRKKVSFKIIYKIYAPHFLVLKYAEF